MTHWWRKVFNHMKYVSQEHFDQAMYRIDARIDGAVATMREDFRYILREMKNEFQLIHNEIRDTQDEMVLMKKALVETTDTGRHLLNLTDELRKHGIPIEDSRVFKKT